MSPAERIATAMRATKDCLVAYKMDRHRDKLLACDAVPRMREEAPAIRCLMIASPAFDRVHETHHLALAVAAAARGARKAALEEAETAVRNLAGRDADETHGILVSKGEALRVVRALAEKGAHDAR